jgi:hypothetical protein
VESKEERKDKMEGKKEANGIWREEHYINRVWRGYATNS